MAVPLLTVSYNGQGVVPGDLLNTFLQGAPNVTYLRSFTGLSNMNVFVQAYATPGDGGGGIFYWNATSTATDDGMTVIAPNGLSVGRWIRVGFLFSSLAQNPVLFTASGSYRPSTPAILGAFVETGGPGGGGGGVAGSNSQAGGGGGGGGGAYASVWVPASVLVPILTGASPIAVSVPAGGAGGSGGAGQGQATGPTTFGTLCGAGEGGGGIGSTGGAAGGGVPGTALYGTTGLTGSAGGPSPGASIATVSGIGGTGGACPRFGGAVYGPVIIGGVAAGNSAVGFGSGGSGAACCGSTGTANGGAGGNGICLATEWIA
jgi:hypothetical protein